MASRLDACASRIETAVRMGQVTTSMQGVVKGMDKGLKSMNIEEISKTMDRFEQVRKRVLSSTSTECIHTPYKRDKHY
jgi:charged multivesicular body protein 1